MIKAFVTMWNQPGRVINCKELIIREGAKVVIDGEETQMLVVVSADEIIHPVVGVEVM